jgi:hypothetical protein
MNSRVEEMASIKNDTNIASVHCIRYLDTPNKNIRNPESIILLATLNDIAGKYSTNRLHESNQTLAQLSGIKEEMILKNLKALQREGAIRLKYQRNNVRGTWVTCRTIVINSLNSPKSSNMSKTPNLLKSPLTIIPIASPLFSLP